jgi:hypothetical protein
MTHQLRRPLAALVSIAAIVAVFAAPLDAQTSTQKPPQTPQGRGRGAQAPAPRRPAPARGATAKPAPPEAAKAVEPPPPPAPQDVRFKTIYTAGDQKTETVTFAKGERERFEFQDMVLLKQYDQKRVIQISRAANTYLVAPEGMPPAAPAAAPAAPPKPPGVVMVATTIVDTGERKAMFGQQARHVKTIIDKQPAAGACDTSKQRIETDGWYIDTPKAIEARAAAAAPTQTPPAAGDCADQITATHNGDPKALGFPIAYTTTIVGDDGKPSVVSMEVTEFEATTLDAALFEIPAGMNAALNVGELGRALSDANEKKLITAQVAATAAPAPKTPGVIRIGVPEPTNKTTTAVDTRTLRADLVENLTEAKFEAVPLAAGTPQELQKIAAERGIDYLVMAEITELKVSKGGGLGGLMKAASKVAGPAAGVAGAAVQGNPNPAEAAVSVKLLQPDGKQRMSTTAKGKDGGGFSMKSGLGLAKFAGGMYMSMFMGPQMMSKMYRVSALTGGNLGGLGMLGNPAMFQMQAMGMGMGMGMGAGIPRGVGIDQTAGAASFIMQQAMAMNSATSSMAAPGGISYAESLGEALDNGAKAIAKALEKK